MPKTSKIAQKTELFVQKYIELGFNGTAAAIAAGYSPRSARTTASVLLARPNVQRILQACFARVTAKIEIAQEELLRQALVEAMLDPTEILELEGGLVSVRDLKKVPLEIRRCIEEVAQTQNGIRLKFSSKSAARDFIARVKGWYKDQPYTGGARLIFKNAHQDEAEDAEIVSE